MKKSVIFDVDCVLIDFYKGLEGVYSKLFGKEVSSLSLTYNLKNRYGLTDDEFNAIWEEFDKDAFSKMPALEGAVEVFNAYKNAGYSTHIVTGIKESVKQFRWNNLEELGMLPDTLDCVGSGTSSKKELIDKYEANIIFDDRLQHLSGLIIPNRILIDNGDDQIGYEENRFLIATEVHDSVLKYVHNSDTVDAGIREEVSSYFPIRKRMSL